MKTLIILIIFMLMQSRSSSAQATFYTAKAEIEAMLAGNAPLSYERAVFLTENAYHDNKADYETYQKVLSLHTDRIQQLYKDSYNEASVDLKSTIYESSAQKKEKYSKALMNWAIYTYMTDTMLFIYDSVSAYFHLPYQYTASDPFGTTDWTNTQVMGLLDNKQGNCYAMAALFKIFSERLNTQAYIATAPNHVFIQHRDHKGSWYNIELASRAFPGLGSLELYTYSTDEAVKNEISMRRLSLQQSVAMCLVYLAKGYEQQYGNKENDFMLQCAEAALQYDSLNLNALLLKAEVLESNLLAQNQPIAQLKNNKTFYDYEKLIIKLYNLGYREMPVAMKNLLLSKMNKDNFIAYISNNSIKPFEEDKIKKIQEYATLSQGLFEERHAAKSIEKYNHTLFNTVTKTITQFAPADTTYNNYDFDPVVFALSIDPLAHKYASWSPYAFVMNSPIMNMDPDGRDTLRMNIKQQASDQYSVLFKVTFSLIEEKVERTIDAPFTMKLLIYAPTNKGKNALPDDVYNIKYQDMASRPQYKNSIFVQPVGKGQFIHEGEDWGWSGGCFIAFSEFDEEEFQNTGTIKTLGREDSKNVLKDLRSLYDYYKSISEEKGLNFGFQLIPRSESAPSEQITLPALKIDKIISTSIPEPEIVR